MRLSSWNSSRSFWEYEIPFVICPGMMKAGAQYEWGCGTRLNGFHFIRNVGGGSWANYLHCVGFGQPAKGHQDPR